MGSVGELSKVYSQMTCLQLARIGTHDILWSVNKLARAVTTWTKACDKRLARLISCIHQTCQYRPCCQLGHTAQRCRVGLFQDSDFAGYLQDSKSTSRGFLCIFGRQTFVPMSWMRKKTTSVSHGSTEAEVISLDAGLRMARIPELDLWDLVTEVFHSSPNQINKTKDRKSQGNLSQNIQLRMKNQTPTKHINLDLNNVHHVSSNARSSRFGAMLYVFEDNETMIKMIIKGRSPTMRHVSRIHRVVLDWLFERNNLDPKIQIRFFDTKHQLADILTEGHFPRDEWNILLNLFNISHFSSLCCALNFSLNSCPKTMAKRIQEKKRRRQGCCKIKADHESDFNCLDKFLIREPSRFVENPGDTQSIYRKT